MPAVRFRDGAIFVLAVFLCMRVALSMLAVGTVGRIELPAAAVSSKVSVNQGWHNAFDGTDRWDAWWFQRIAVQGYEDGAAFFPGYPLAIRGVMWALPLGSLGAALLVSNVSSSSP